MSSVLIVGRSPTVRYDILPFVLVALLAGTVLGAVALRVRPQSRWQWTALWLTATFLVLAAWWLYPPPIAVGIASRANSRGQLTGT
jgi:hypothetical protein